MAEVATELLLLHLKQCFLHLVDIATRISVFSFAPPE
jgi:hypothetical protein